MFGYLLSALFAEEELNTALDHIRCLLGCILSVIEVGCFFVDDIYDILGRVGA